MTYIEGELGSAIVQFKNNLKRERDSALMHQMEGAC